VSPRDMLGCFEVFLGMEPNLGMHAISRVYHSVELDLREVQLIGGVLCLSFLVVDPCPSLSEGSLDLLVVVGYKCLTFGTVPSCRLCFYRGC
ncbi:hypothetical protein L195_g053961, partial [Trifolium pratense]